MPLPEPSEGIQIQGVESRQDDVGDPGDWTEGNSDMPEIRGLTPENQGNPPENQSNPPENQGNPPENESQNLRAQEEELEEGEELENQNEENISGTVCFHWRSLFVSNHFIKTKNY